MATPPKYHMIVPDRSLRESTLESATSQGGIKGNVAFASTSNNGNAKLFLDGTPTNETTYNFLINDSGSINQSSFLWKKSTETDDDYRGENDLRFIHDAHSPFTNFGTDHCSAAYIENLDREILYNKYDEDTIKAYYRTASDTFGNYSWSVQTIDITNIAGLGIDGSFDVCVLKDEIIMCVSYDNDIHIYKSTDGLSFSLIAKYIFSRFFGKRVFSFSLKIASSGNFLRIIFSAPNPNNSQVPESLFSMTSFDGGNSWKLTNSRGIDGFIADAALTGKYSTGSRYIYDICKYDDNGTFIIIMMENSSRVGYFGRFVATYTAYSDQPYQLNENLEIPTNSPASIFIQSSPDYLIALILDTATNQDQLQGNLVYTLSDLRITKEYKIYLKLKSEDLNTPWIDLNTQKDISTLNLVFQNNFDKFAISGLFGHGRDFPKVGKLVSTGADLFLFASVFDYENLVDQRTTSYFKISGWSNRPAYDKNYENYILNVNDIPTFDQLQKIDEIISEHQPAGRFMVAQWYYINGKPAGGVSSGSKTPWQLFRTNSIASNTSSSMAILDLVSTGQCIFRYIDPHILNSAYSNPNYNIGQNADSPPTNWFFVPRNTNSVFPDSNLYHGSCIRWVMKVTGGTTSSTSCFVRINGYLGKDASFTGLTFIRIQVAVRLAETGLVIRDEIAGSNLATLTPPSGTYGSTPFADEFWEFRWAWFAQDSVANTANCVLVCRKLGTNAWLSTDIVQPTNETSFTYPSSDIDLYRQAVQFGHASATIGQVSRWREFGVHAGNDMSTFRLSNASFTSVPVFDKLSRTQAYRGRLTSLNPILITDKTRAIWGGGGASEGDSFTADIAYSYSGLNPVKYNSPRVQYRSAENMATGIVDLVFKAPDNEYFHHSAISVFGVNCNILSVAYSDTGSSFTTASTISFVQAKGVVSSASGNKVAVDFDSSYSVTNAKFSSDDKKSFLLGVGSASGGAIWSNNDQYRIDRMYGQDTLLLSTGVTQNFDSSIVGSTVIIYGSSGEAVYTKPVTNKYMRLRLSSFNNFTPDGYASLGTVIAGTTYTFDVPLDFEFQDDEQPNVQLMRSRGNISWGYKLGPAARKLELSMNGDVTQQKRREFRDLTRTAMNYSQFGMVLVNDANTDDLDNIFLGRLTSGSDNENVGFYYDETNQRWLPIGDLSIVFEEIV